MLMSVRVTPVLGLDDIALTKQQRVLHCRTSQVIDFAKPVLFSATGGSAKTTLLRVRRSIRDAVQLKSLGYAEPYDLSPCQRAPLSQGSRGRSGRCADCSLLDSATM